MVSLNEEELRAMQSSANFQRAIPEFEREVAEEINVVPKRNMTILVLNDDLIVRINIRKCSFGVPDDVRVGKVVVSNEPSAFRGIRHCGA